MKFARWLAAWTVAVVVTAVIGSVVQTQLNIARIVELGAEVGIGQRLETTLQDLLGFAPLWAIIVAAGLLVALLTAGGLSRLWPSWSLPLHLLAGLTAPLVALLLMEAMMPVTVVAAARTWTGLVLMSLPGVIGGWLYLVVLQRQKGQTFHQAAQRNSSSQAGS